MHTPHSLVSTYVNPWKSKKPEQAWCTIQVSLASGVPSLILHVLTQQPRAQGNMSMLHTLAMNETSACGAAIPFGGQNLISSSLRTRWGGASCYGSKRP